MRKRHLIVLPLLFVFFLTMPAAVMGRSAHSPRHSGLEPPGSPRSLGIMPERALSQTPDGGKGYTDAYGNPVKARDSETSKSKSRLSPGAYGHKKAPSDQGAIASPLPDNTPPVWNFH